MGVLIREAHQPVAPLARREHFPFGAFVVEAVHGPIHAEGQANPIIFQNPSLPVRPGDWLRRTQVHNGNSVSGDADRQLPAVPFQVLGTVHRCRIEHGNRLFHTFSIQSCGQELFLFLDSMQGLQMQLGIAGLSLGINPVNGRTRKAIVELIEHHVLPDFAEPISWVVAAQGAKPFQRMQVLFQSPVPFFLLSHGRIGSLVPLKIQLPMPIPVLVCIFFDSLEEIDNEFVLQRRSPLQIPGPSAPLHVFISGTAASVSQAVKLQSSGADILVRIVVLPVDGHLRHRSAGVAILRQHMGQNPGPVHAVPPEGISGEPVRIVHGQLIGGKVRHARLDKQLRQGGAVSENVRQKAHLHILAEFLPEESFSVEKLPHQRFAAG